VAALLAKAVISGVVVVAAAEVAKRSSLLGAVIVSLPLTSILALTWLWLDTRDVGEVASLSWSILWIVLPSVTFFVALPVGLRAGLPFAAALAVACAVTAAAYALWVWAGRALGIGA